MLVSRAAAANGSVAGNPHGNPLLAGMLHFWLVPSSYVGLCHAHVHVAAVLTGRALLAADQPAQPLRVTTVAGVKQKFSSQLDIRVLMELSYLYVRACGPPWPACLVDAMSRAAAQAMLNLHTGHDGHATQPRIARQLHAAWMSACVCVALPPPVQIEGGNDAQLALGVHAVARVAQEGSIHGTVVKILTLAGTVTLDGTSILLTVGCMGIHAPAIR